VAHFAKLDNNNIVIEVNSVNNNVLDLNDEENSGIAFLTEWSNGYSNWKQTSYNKNFRVNYAGVGYKYDPDFDVFIAPQPYPSWKLNYTTFQWEAPVAKPEDIEGYIWKWSEYNKEWIQVAIPSN
jgi:hypothetical protein